MSVRKHHPFAFHCEIKGKRYNYLTFGDTKVEARRRADSHRKKFGGSVRVIREKSEFSGKIIYTIWTRRVE